MTPIIFATLACFIPVTTGLSASEEFKQLTDEYWAWRLEDSPELATLLNVHTYANQTERFDLEVLSERKQRVDQFVKDLAAIDRLELSPGQRTSYDVLYDTLTTYAAGYRWRFYGPMHPVNFLEGLWNDPKLFIPASLTTYDDFASFAERISGWAKESTSMMERMNKSIEMNTTNHNVSIEGVVSQIDSFLGTDEMDCVLYEPFNETLDEADISDEEKETLRTIGKESISELREAYKVMKDYVEDVYMAHTRDEVGVGSFEKGSEYYKACLKWHLSVDMRPKAIHRLGLREVERISRQMNKILERMNFDGSIREFFNSLNNNPSFIANSEDDVITMYEDIVKNRIGPKLEEYFGDIPDMPVKVEPMPNDGPGGSYTFGSPDGAREGVFYVNTFRRKDNPTYAMMSLALHEADPGHHLQDIFSQSAEGLPDFRKVVDDSKYFSPPLHFPIYTAYLEGWALYSESLGEADYLDVYRDDYELMGRYSEEIFRACRLVVDTGMHYYDWPRDKAIEYMMKYTTISRQALTIEVNRYITWPGQACAYKVGELKIKDLRSRSKALLGKDFDIKQFHTVILKNGAVPLDVLENLVMDWTKEKREAVRAAIVNRTLSFHELIKEYWQWRMEDAPEFASSLRVKDFAHKAEQYNLEVLQLRKESVDDFLTLLTKIDRYTLNDSDKVSYEVLKDTLTTYSEGYKWRDYCAMNPVNFLEGILTEPSYYGPQELEQKIDFEDYIQRLQGFVTQVNDFIERMQIAIDECTTNHWVSMTRAIKQFETFANQSPNETALLEPFLKALDENTTISEEDKKSLAVQAESVMIDLQQNYMDLKDFIEKEYQPDARAALGVSSFKDGEDYYRACLKWHLSVDLSPEEIHQKGLDEVARIHGEMLKVAARLNFTGSTKEFFESLLNDKRFFLDSSEEVIARYTDIVNKRVKPKLGRYFRDVPDMPVKVEPMPYDGPGGSYTFGTPDGSKPGVFYVNVKRPTKSPTYGMVALALHEADPGHHLQDTFAQASESMPVFRRVMDYTKYFAVPVHYPFYTAYTEGWALYAESLGEKEHLDIYQDDYELMGRYSSEIFRACRLVVDTGLHYYNWTREQSIQYMQNYTGFSREALKLEIDRYITWPGQACAYKIGEMKIKELRQLAEEELGEDFDMRDFHSVVLNNGAVPLDVLEQLVNDWIIKYKQASDTFEKVANDFFEWRKMHSPEFSSGVGYKYNDKVDSYKYEKFEAQKVEATRFLDRLMSLSRSDLSEETQVSYDVLEDILATFLAGYKWRDYQLLNPINFLAGSLEFERFGSDMPFDTQGDFINYVRRVELLPDKYQEMINLTRRAIENGNTNHNASLSRVQEHLEKITLKNIADTALYRPFKVHGVKLFGDGPELMHVQKRLEDALQRLKEKLEQVSTFVTEEYMPKSRPGFGLGTLPNGRENYKACLKWHTSLDISPEEVHEMGKAEVARIMKRIHESMEVLNYNSSWTISQLYEHMRSDERFLFSTPEKTLSHFRDIIFKRIQPKLHKYFSNVPSLPLEIKASVSDGIRGEYVYGSADGSRPGTFYANVHRKEDNPTFSMISLSLHETIPGHHLAESYAQMSSIPKFRKHMEWRSDSVPYFFPFYNAYVEGWALYSEFLGEEMGIYEDHYELLGRFSHEMHRACRLVVDTGIHYYNWTREDAIAYMLNYTALTPNMAAIEIDRYATWPGQACGYKIGEIKIKELRQRAEQELGDRFDLKDFHYTVLKNGPMPLGVLERVVGDWIKSLRHPNSTLVKFPPGCTSRAPLPVSLGLLTCSLVSLAGGGMWL